MWSQPDKHHAAFAIWTQGREFAWARRAWMALTKAGLTRYTTELERCAVLVRFLALAGLYHDFCEMAWDEQSGASDLYCEWASELELNHFRIGQMTAAGPDPIGDEEEPPVTAALRYLADHARPEVFETLKAAGGGVTGLFISLWKTATTRQPYETVADEEDEIVNVGTDEKLRAFAWIEEGCPPL